MISTSSGRVPTIRRMIGVVVVVVFVALTGLIAYNASRRAVDTTPALSAAPSKSVVTARAGTLTDTRAVRVLASWQVTGTQVTRRAGTVTWARLAAGTQQELSEGEHVYSIDELPTIVIGGAVPAYRTLEPGSVGEDVAQVQRFLQRQGDFDEATDGTWSAQTTAALNAWQQSAGLPTTSSLQLGDVVFLPTLPVRAVAAQNFTLGAVVPELTPAFSTLATQPTFELLNPGDGQDLYGKPVQVQIGADKIDLVSNTSPTTTADMSTSVVQLIGRNDAPCQPGCAASIPVEGTEFAATAVIAGPATGTLVPPGALRTNAAGELFVVRPSGETVTVQVVLEVGAEAVVTGLESGAEVVLPGS